MEPILQLGNVVLGFRGPDGAVPVLTGVSLAVAPGEFVTVQGKSGSGKTTLLLVAGGLFAPDEGTVTLKGESLYGLPTEARSRFRAAHLGFVFQQFHLIPYLSVLDNILAAGLAAPSPGAESRARELAGRFGLAHRLRHVPAALSTGEQQRTALCRALLNRPALLLADEPTGNLDRENGELILAALSEFAAEGGAVLLVTHDPAATRHAHRALRLRNGMLEADG
jgi:putative ABC transport system ATP-binding protein